MLAWLYAANSKSFAGAMAFLLQYCFRISGMRPHHLTGGRAHAAEFTAITVRRINGDYGSKARFLLRMRSLRPALFSGIGCSMPPIPVVVFSRASVQAGPNTLRQEHRRRGSEMKKRFLVLVTKLSRVSYLRENIHEKH